MTHIDLKITFAESVTDNIFPKFTGLDFVAVKSKEGLQKQQKMSAGTIKISTT